MKVLYLAPSQSSLGGGVTEIQRNLGKALSEIGIEVSAFGIHDSKWLQEEKEWSPVPVRCFPSIGPKGFGYSPELHREVRKNVDTHDILHLHCLWLDTSRIALNWKVRHRKPLVVSINGFLEGWALRHHRWRKNFVTWLYERQMLNSADVLHANTIKELNDIRAFGLKNRVEVIPNGVSKVEYKPLCSQDGVNKIIFLGRLHPKKGITRFLDAWGRVSKGLRRNWHVIISGWGDKKYLRELDSCILRNGLSNEVDIEGPKFGDQKKQFIQDSTAMFLTSESEGMPMAALECLAHGRTLLMTSNCNINVSGYERAAIVTEISTESIKQGIERLLSLTKQELQQSSQDALSLARDQYCWSQIAEMWQKVYSTL